jgi:hypothetical protein
MNPDSSIIEFVKKYISSLALGPGKWTVHTIIGSESHVQIPTEHSTSFKVHPFFQGKYVDGEIHFLTLESNNVINGLRDIHLILNYADKESAVNDFNSLLNKFETSHFKKIVDTSIGIISVKFSYIDDPRKANLQFILFKDQITPKKFQILYRFRHPAIVESEDDDFLHRHYYK